MYILAHRIDRNTIDGRNPARARAYGMIEWHNNLRTPFSMLSYEASWAGARFQSFDWFGLRHTSTDGKKMLNGEIEGDNSKSSLVVQDSFHQLFHIVVPLYIDDVV